MKMTVLIFPCEHDYSCTIFVKCPLENISVAPGQRRRVTYVSGIRPAST